MKCVVKQNTFLIYEVSIALPIVNCEWIKNRDTGYFRVVFNEDSVREISW